ncbi:hypothetical protein FNH09_33540 [Streptomyces adustus]|uniref:Uncharacterized protein n=1 Tax=Streptomyces adustus TaxID=1609272 RepID=A0A5N8VPJ2_9ACTN|nr:hypothetical protein [Streptomyces adustus]MPY35978.1 hypothetical protein [Streptomyces adustus]
MKAFASASTGRAIRGLHGAAARSAALAWLGGGAQAAGGGGQAAGAARLSAMGVASAKTAAKASAAAVSQWQKGRVRRGQDELVRDVEQRERKLSEAEAAAPAQYELHGDTRRFYRNFG